MKYTHLGRTGLKVSRIALGTMNFGELSDEAASIRIMDEALDAGINFFDTADVYGGPQSPDMAMGYGTSEEIIGRWLARGGQRDRIVLATKVYQPMDTGPNDKYLSAYHIRRACEASLKRLKTDHIDLYQMHHVDRVTPWEEIWQAMEQLIREGKITYVGSSNFAGWDIATAQCGAASRNLFRGARSAWDCWVGCCARSRTGGAPRPCRSIGSKDCARNWPPTRPRATNSARRPPPWPWPGCCTIRS